MPKISSSSDSRGSLLSTPLSRRSLCLMKSLTVSVPPSHLQKSRMFLHVSLGRPVCESAAFRKPRTIRASARFVRARASTFSYSAVAGYGNPPILRARKGVSTLTLCVSSLLGVDVNRPYCYGLGEPCLVFPLQHKGNGLADHR
jgi:hypothetical protein